MEEILEGEDECMQRDMRVKTGYGKGSAGDEGMFQGPVGRLVREGGEDIGGRRRLYKEIRVKTGYETGNVGMEECSRPINCTKEGKGWWKRGRRRM